MADLLVAEEATFAKAGRDDGGLTKSNNDNLKHT